MKRITGHTSNHIFVFAALLLILLIYAWENAIARPLINGFLTGFVPCSIVALSMSDNQSFIKIVKWYDVLMIILTIGAFRSSLLAVEQSDIVLAGGGSYQIASYMAAFAFVLNLFMLFFGSLYNDIRFTYCKKRLYSIVCIVMLPIQIASVFLSGGRGGFILIVLSALVLSIIRYKKEKGKLIFGLIGAFFLLFFSLRFIGRYTGDAFFDGFSRVFSYITSSGIDLSQTSNREIVYDTAIQYINEKPIFGYGFFKYFDIVGFNPHNFILEVLLQGGIFYLLIVTIILLLFFSRMKTIIRCNFLYIAIIPILLYPFTMLLFSGSYVAEGMFAFAIIFVLSEGAAQKSSIALHSN